MRLLLATLCLFAIVVSTHAQTVQDQVRLHFEEEMRGPLRLVVMSMRANSVPLDDNATDIDRQVEKLLPQAFAAYKPEFTISEKEAQRLLSDGPDQKANLAAIKENFVLMQRSPLPKPAIISSMLGPGQFSLESYSPWRLETLRRLTDGTIRQLRERGEPLDPPASKPTPSPTPKDR